jgi:hypothetical protein
VDEWAAIRAHTSPKVTTRRKGDVVAATAKAGSTITCQILDQHGTVVEHESSTSAHPEVQCEYFADLH